MQVVVAVITRPHGLKGDVALELRTDSPQQRFIAGATFHTSDGRQLTLRRGWQHSGRWLVAFREVADRTGAEELRGLELRIDAPASDEEDAWYPHELAGLPVELLTGQKVGEVIGIEHLPVQDALVIREPSGAQTLIPMVRQLIPHIDVAGGLVRIDPPAGLLADLPDPDEGGDGAGSDLLRERGETGPDSKRGRTT